MIIIIIIIIIIVIVIIISNGDKTEWSPIRSVIITSEKQTVAVKVKYSPFCFGRSFSEVGCCC